MKVVVLGATGVVGRAAVEHFAALDGTEVVGVSRRRLDVPGAHHVALDLADREACAAAFAGGRAAPGRSAGGRATGAFAGTTHVVFAALHEAPDLVSGWHDPALMAHNLALFRNALEPLAAAHGDTLRHVSLLQGGKAYGLHLGRLPVPAKERAPRDPHDNFYFLQEDALRRLAAEAGFAWTILRPQVVYGESLASPMNLLPAIGAYAALETAAGRALAFPGGGRGVHEAVDARLLAQVLAWAAVTPAAHGEAFNVTNGDVFDWHEVWPAIAEALGTTAGEPRRQVLAETMPARAGEWAAVVDAHGLRAPRDLAGYVGASWIYADMLFGTHGARPLPALLSTVKLRRAGFAGCIDTEDMFREWFARLRERRLLP